MRVITISNQKGGVAKTTTAIALAAALAQRGKRVLAIDLDPQSNLTMGLGLEPDRLERSSVHVLLGECAPGAAIVPTQVKGLWLLPADLTLAGAEKRLYGEIGFDEVLRSRLRPLAAAGAYDHVVIDCPPSLGLLTVNAITAAETVLVPVQCEFFSARGLGQLLEIAGTVREKRNPGLVLKILPTLFDQRNKICKQIHAELAKSFPMNLLASKIGVDTRVRESAVAGTPITVFDPASRAAEEYMALADEVLSHEAPALATPPAAAPQPLLEIVAPGTVLATPPAPAIEIVAAGTPAAKAAKPARGKAPAKPKGRGKSKGQKPIRLAEVA